MSVREICVCKNCICKVCVYTDACCAYCDDEMITECSMFIEDDETVCPLFTEEN
ncbi:hypothetical protein SAMN05660649_04351 [Desulfotomaculum arcticum]|uniref:Uncharacterized protein n=1 Tax=Desulfotruncus arcticus DSM 17038 TaxID=1121424 RepID=A0A1I2YAP2_9FIRM|nr:hypothetical protein SAMN05660649_04351 [Desulfotomaculum arcticum] [Desulfotruncus arcticus DSM 17038]